MVKIIQKSGWKISKNKKLPSSFLLGEVRHIASRFECPTYIARYKIEADLLRE